MAELETPHVSTALLRKCLIRHSGAEFLLCFIGKLASGARACAGKLMRSRSRVSPLVYRAIDFDWSIARKNRGRCASQLSHQLKPRIYRSRTVIRVRSEAIIETLDHR